MSILVAACGLSLAGNRPAVDTSQSHLDKLIDRYEYYFFQKQNPFLSETQKKKCGKKAQLFEKKITQIENERVKQGTDSSDVLKNIQTLFPEQKPLYAFEPRSFLMGIGTSFSGFSYFQPVYAYFESACLGSRISVGGYGGFFTERKYPASGHSEEHPSYTFTKQLYKYNYVNFGVRGTYDLLNLGLPLNSKIFDLYATAVIGYNLAFLKTYLENTTVPYESPKKQGINAGAMFGLRYFPTDDLNLFAEAGYTRTAYLNIGFGYRFMPRAHKQDEQTP